ncbi:MAG: 3-methylornithyl-N6-L-lysine dehydrogenase PylD [Desulfobacula sp.]|uniref:3-methylornithyl-N6-L-lysine dehydrogenase PylD n=2 Tax=Desulfobacula sp. TaxID=2593537 RepID=UPI001DA1677A|nr:3-methylornithyl-N6-L-lysine dehydrogenase PylD [Desulfobacula sp.]MBT4026938.1 3-methylornithyl-N6-L-lysine dehydrogenase PylD [Desulfobacula sp.]MBT4198616.1 3-methylornithyl-N6-L-lysine dehydrogenase PylD [Desulfobacula sp.]MBT4505537.1 3-methylornithyl-N6-L-lysine dehydrogenase PylD [Desulfobacula sp.]MBT4874658.1 3-methylornithyl-N6-L-lysine dehydrogenase PylD [Desulfobacula sp.]
MTRLTSSDIDSLSDQLTGFDERLKKQTGRDMLGVACHSQGLLEKNIHDKIRKLTIAVVTITAGLGKITGFAQTVKDILNHIGFQTFIPAQKDAAGLALAIERKTDIIFMADDNRYFAFNLKNTFLIDNIQATGDIFAAALDLMAKGIKDKKALVLGAGPVGMAAARKLIKFGANVGVHDKDMEKCQKNCAEINKSCEQKIEPVHDLKSVDKKFCFFLEATNAKDVIKSSMIGPRTFIAAPGVPLGVTQKGQKKADNRILYDPLQLGTAAMAVSAAFPIQRG